MCLEDLSKRVHVDGFVGGGGQELGPVLVEAHTLDAHRVVINRYDALPFRKVPDPDLAIMCPRDHLIDRQCTLFQYRDTIRMAFQRAQ